MFKLTGNNTLKITQGDTGTLTITPRADTFGSSDKVQLTITDKAKKNVLLQKVVGFTNNVASIPFVTADTANIAEGVYLWELRFVKGATVTEGVITAGTSINTPYENMALQIIDALGDIGATTGGT